MISQNDIKSELVETKKELQKNTEGEFNNIPETKVVERVIFFISYINSAIRISPNVHHFVTFGEDK